MQIARSWRQQASNLRLVGSFCSNCKTIYFPERLRCCKCGDTNLKEYQLDPQGTVFALTTVYEAPFGFDVHVPYLAAVVKLKEGPFVSTMLTDVEFEDAKIGMEVSMVTRRISVQGDDGPIVYAYKFAPIF